MNEQGTSILIVEDDPEILSILENIFTKHFNKIFTAINGKFAQQILGEFTPDIILSDIHMPECSGIDFITKIRAQGKNIPIVLISTSKDHEDLLKALKLGVQDFVEKPFKKIDVEMAVHRALEMSVRINDLPELIVKFGQDSSEVKHQKKLIGLLQAISSRC